jgi:alpha-tubulin suppressor-like RCC1 family protein
MRTLLRVALKRTLIIGAAACAAGASVTGAAAGAALGQSGATIQHWGAFASGGKPEDTNLTPVSLSLPAPVAQLSSSNSTQYALLTNGTVYAWGLGADGQLGNGGTADSFTTAVKVKFPAGIKIASLPADAMPYDTAFAVDTNGNVWGWGLNEGGELCMGNTTQYLTPVKLPFTQVTTLAGGGDHATYDANGILYSCGTNEYGQLGNGSENSSTTKVKVMVIKGTSVRTLVASYLDVGALQKDGDYFDWGYNTQGQLGNGSFESADMPAQVGELPATVTQVAIGGSTSDNGQTLVMLSNGALYAWGADADYQLGDGKRANEQFPEEISPPAGVTYATLASGGDTSYAITTQGDVYAWGASGQGQVGDGQTAPAKKPLMIESGATLISASATDVVVSAGS